MDFFVWQRTCVDEAGNVLPSASVTVTDVVSGALATLYSDEGVTGIGNPITADSNGFIQFYVKSGVYDITASLGGDSRTWSDEAVGAPFKKNAAGIAAGVTVTNYQYPWGWVERYGADPTGVSSSTSAINAALSCDQAVYLGGLGSAAYLASGLTQSHDFQQIIALSKSHLNKNANGTLLTSSGDDVLFQGIDFRDAGSAYTGKGLVCSGDRVRVDHCGGYLIESTCLEMTGAAPQVIGTCNIYQTRTGAGYDIVIGVSGTATLYARITDVYTSHAAGGIQFIDCGSNSVVGGQIGKLFVDSGTSPAGVNGGTYSNLRILGDIEVEISNSSFAACQVGGVTIHFASGTSGHRFDESNIVQSSPAATIDDDSNNSYVVDSRESAQWTTYSVSWTTSGTAPSVGNGSLDGRYVKQGKRVRINIKLIWGSSTSGGTGNWTFSLPAVPGVQEIGQALMLESGVNTEGGFAVMADGVATLQVYPSEAPASAINASTPFTWGTSDELTISAEYYTD